jgi:3-oxoacyl-[acyl-carrier-protein] synthase-3
MFPEWSVQKISSKTGIYKRHVANEDEFVSDMAISAAQQLFNEHNINKADIDFLLICTQSPDYFLPTTACIVQHKLELSTHCGALDFNLGCSGFVYGLSLADGLIASQNAKNILLITSETYTKYINYLDKSNRTIFGDAAVATLVSLSYDKKQTGKFVFGTDGSGSENLIVKNGGSRNAERTSENIFDEGQFIRNDNNLYMNGQEIFKFTTAFVPSLIDETLQKNNLILDDIELFVFHQANKFMLDYIRKKIKIPEHKFFLYLENVGNTVSSTIPLAIQEAIKKKIIKDEMKVLIAGFGVGYSYAATILQF